MSIPTFSKICIAALIAGACQPVESAFAEIKFCNNFAQRVFVAIAYEQVYSSSDTGWMSRGWLSVDPNDCQIFDTTLKVPFFYFRGETDWYKVNSRKNEKNTWGEAGDGNMFLTTTKSFQFWDAQNNVKVDGVTTSYDGFIKSIESGDGDISETVTFEADGIHDTQTMESGSGQ